MKGDHLSTNSLHLASRSLHLVALGLFMLPVSQAAQLDKSSQEALQKTQELLNNPTLREQNAASDPNAKKWNDQVQQMSGNTENREEIYKIAAEVFGDLTQNSGGDATKMMQIMEQAKTNPEAFYNSLTPAQKARIQKLSTRLPAAAQGSAAAPSSDAGRSNTLPVSPGLLK